MRTEQEQLLKQLRVQHDRELQELPEQHAAGPSVDTNAYDDLHQRYDMALQDVRELRGETDRLAKQLADAQKHQVAGPAPLSGFDWETQKQRLLAQLEDDFDGSDPVQVKDRLTMESTVRITDDVVATKDREIAELKELLQQQAENIDSSAVGASAIAEVLDQDELIRKERENLARLREELREKLRQAEIEASLERARLAREHASVDEKLRVLEQEKARLHSKEDPADPDKSEEFPPVADPPRDQGRVSGPNASPRPWDSWLPTSSSIDGPPRFEGHSWPFAAAGRTRPDVYVGSSIRRAMFLRMPAAAKAAAGRQTDSRAMPR